MQGEPALKVDCRWKHAQISSGREARRDSHRRTLNVVSGGRLRQWEKSHERGLIGDLTPPAATDETRKSPARGAETAAVSVADTPSPVPDPETAPNYSDQRAAARRR